MRPTNPKEGETGVTETIRPAGISHSTAATPHKGLTMKFAFLTIVTVVAIAALLIGFTVWVTGSTAGVTDNGRAIAAVIAALTGRGPTA